MKVMLTGTSPDSETSEHALITPTGNSHAAPIPALPNQALHVLTMAQRTAEEHIATAQHQAEKIRNDAAAAADQIARDAQIHAHNVRREADKVLADARAAADHAAREAQARAEDAHRNVERIAGEANARAEAIAGEARAEADQLKLQAQQRYDDIVGSLGTRREALQQQIEALEVFDQEYRSRLTKFMQGQMRALWMDQPQVTTDLEPIELAQHAEPAPAEMPGGADTADEQHTVAEIPHQRHAVEATSNGVHASVDA